MNKNVIIILLNYKSHPSWFKGVILPKMEQYARKHSADIEIIGSEIEKWDPEFRPKFKYGGKLFHKAWYRLLLWKYFLNSRYDKALFIDHDELILDTSYNIFDICESNIVCSTTQWLEGSGNQKTEPNIANFAKMNNKLDLYNKLKELKYQINGGIHVVDKQSAKTLYENVFIHSDLILRENGEKPYDAYKYIKGPGEQPYFTYKFMETGLCHFLPPNVHATPESKKDNTVFLHFIGPDRKKQIIHYEKYV